MLDAQGSAQMPLCFYLSWWYIQSARLFVHASVHSGWSGAVFDSPSPSPEGAGFIGPLIMRDRPAMPPSHSSFFPIHPSRCVRLLSLLFRLLPSTEHRFPSLQPVFPLSFSANFNFCPDSRTPSAPPPLFLSPASAPEGLKVPVSDSPSIFFCVCVF